MWTIPELKNRAKALLPGNYWGYVLAALLLGLTSQGGGAAVPFDKSSLKDLGTLDFEQLRMVIIVMALILVAALLIGFALAVFVFIPLRIGITRYFVVGQYRKPEFGEIGLSFRKGNYKNLIMVEVWRYTYLTLWTLLFIVPGIVKGYEYRMIPYLLAENPQMSKEAAFQLSKKMMDGEKGHAFLLDLSFIGWYLLVALTCGLLGIFYVMPYANLTDAALYAKLREKGFA